MITIQGKGVSKGIAKGPLYFFQRSDTTVTLKVVSDIEAEKARLAVAQEQSIRQLNALADRRRASGTAHRSRAQEQCLHRVV